MKFAPSGGLMHGGPVTFPLFASRPTPVSPLFLPVSSSCHSLEQLDLRGNCSRKTRLLLKETLPNRLILAGVVWGFSGTTTSGGINLAVIWAGFPLSIYGSQTQAALPRFPLTASASSLLVLGASRIFEVKRTFRLGSCRR
jgi:hypothetical protein